MASLSAGLYFLSRYPFWSLLLIVACCNGVALALSHATGSRRWLWLCLPGVVIGIANVPGGRHLNAAFLQACGTPGRATVVGVDEVEFHYSEYPVFAYHAVLRSADGRDFKIDFTTLNAAVYPLDASGLLPPPGEAFVVRYVPGFERNVAIMFEQSQYGRRQRLAEDREPLQRAAAQWALSPGNPAFAAEYREAVRVFVQRHRDELGPAQVRALEQSAARDKP